MGKKRILIIEDEEKIARVLELELTHEGYEVSKALDGYAGLEAYRSGEWDLILLDVMLPGITGNELLRRIRSGDPHTPVILLTARHSIKEKVAGLDDGANDYITKPFQIEELLARIRAALRQQITSTTAEDADWLQVGELRLNEGTREVFRGETEIQLTPREFELLTFFLRHPRQVLDRDQIMNAVWGLDYYGDTNVVDVYVQYLRKKVDQGFATPYIHTVRGVGYVLRA